MDTNEIFEKNIQKTLKKAWKWQACETFFMLWYLLTHENKSYMYTPYREIFEVVLNFAWNFQTPMIYV